MDLAPLLELLQCPACQGPLAPVEQTLTCQACRHPFPVVDEIPVLLVGVTADNLETHFQRYWDSPAQAALYDQKVEGEGEHDLFGAYNHQSELYGLTAFFPAADLSVVLDAGCGNGRFLGTLPDTVVSVGADASLNLLRIARAKGRGRYHVCCALEQLPFREECFTTVLSCRVLQHLREQERAVAEMARVLAADGDLLLELYNTWNPKTLYKALRMSPLAPLFNAPFRLLFRSMSPFAPWGLAYDRYTSWPQARRWLVRAGVGELQGRGVGFGYHKYLFQPFYLDAELAKRAPAALKRYYDACFRLERRLGGHAPFRYLWEKFVIRGRKGAPAASGLLAKAVKTAHHQWHALPPYTRPGRRELARQQAGRGQVALDHLFHLQETLGWLRAAQDATGSGGVARGFSTVWNARFGGPGWQPAYPETTGYLIPTLFDCAAHLDDADLRQRALRMADWELGVQLPSGAVMGGTVDQPPSPAVFNTGQVILGWLRTHRETGEAKYLTAALKAGRFLAWRQSPDGAWRTGNSRYAAPHATTYNARVGWALILLGQAAREPTLREAGRRNLDWVLTRQRDNGWFEGNCLSDPTAPLLHTLCYAVEGLLGGAQALKEKRWQAAALKALRAMAQRVDPQGRIPGRLDHQWRGTVTWDCLTGSAQLAHQLLTAHWLTGDPSYRAPAQRLLAFLKGTQNCAVDAPVGIRGGLHGSYPCDGDYGPYQTLNWAAKFFLDALLMDEQLG